MKLRSERWNSLIAWRLAVWLMTSRPLSHLTNCTPDGQFANPPCVKREAWFTFHALTCLTVWPLAYISHLNN